MNKMKYYLLTSNENWADEFDIPALAVMNEREYTEWLQAVPEIYTYTGNCGDGFMENEQGMSGLELVARKVVKVMEVDENFAEIFKQAELHRLSLSSVLEIQKE